MKSQLDSYLIVGAGIFGAATAYSLLLKGCKSITIIDAGKIVPNPHASSTDISKLVRLEYGKDEFLMNSVHQCMKTWRLWEAQWNPQSIKNSKPSSPVYYHETGIVLFKQSKLDENSFELSSAQSMDKNNILYQKYQNDALKKRFPAWKDSLMHTAFFNPQGGWCQSGNTVKKLLEICVNHGVRLVPGTHVSKLIYKNGHCVGVEVNRGYSYYAKHIIVAAGAWTPRLVPQIKPLLQPVAQHLVFFKLTEKQAKLMNLSFSADLAATGFYGFPAQFIDGEWVFKLGHHGLGEILLPESLEYGEIDQSSFKKVETRFRQFLQQQFGDSIARSPLWGGKTCLYSESKNGDFIISDISPGLYVVSGGSGHGMKFAPIIGEWVYKLIHGVAIERFLVKTHISDIKKYEDARYLGK